jgi:DNA-binding GntR family transcriptional regulator
VHCVDGNHRPSTISVAREHPKDQPQDTAQSEHLQAPLATIGGWDRPESLANSVEFLPAYAKGTGWHTSGADLALFTRLYQRLRAGILDTPTDNDPPVATFADSHYAPRTWRYCMSLARLRRRANLAPPRRQNSAVDTLVEALRRDVMTGRLSPGQRIDLDEWGEEMRASRTPVRLALERLEAEGFVKLSGRRGATIIDVTIAHVEDVLSTRLVLDAALGRVGTMNMTTQDLGSLHLLLKQIEDVKLPEEHVKMVDPAQRFHAQLFHAAGAPMMQRVAMQAVHHTNVFLSSMWFTNRRIAYVGKAYFGQLYKACEGKDIDRVAHLIRGYRVDMAGVILQDRVRTEDLHILPNVLTQPELQRLRAMLDDGHDPFGPDDSVLVAETPRPRTRGLSTGSPAKVDSRSASQKSSARSPTRATRETA